MQDKSVASTAARLATAVMGGATEKSAPDSKMSEIELARENMKKKLAANKKGKKKIEEVSLSLFYQKLCERLLRESGYLEII